MMKFILFCIFISPALCAQDFSFLLPDSVNDWNKSGRADIYVGDELYRLIDGGADIFNEYGFNRVAVQRYMNPGNNFIDVEAYEMKDSSSAYGVFSLFTFKTGERTDSLSEAFTGDQFLLFRKGNYYISLTGSNSLKETTAGLFLVAKAMDVRIAAAGKPILATLFDPEIKSKTVYVKGNLGLYNITKINLGKGFRVEEGISLENGAATIFVFRYGSKDDARKNCSLSLESFKTNGKYKLQHSEPSINVFTGLESCITQICVKRSVAILMAKHRPDLEKISAEITRILNKQD